MLCLGVAPARADGPVSREYQIKAVFLYNFLQFVDWPVDALPREGEPIRIAVLGNSPFGTALEDAVRGETIAGHPLVVVKAERFDQLGHCQLLYVCKSEESRLDDIFARLGDRPMLTVSDLEGFARHGGVIAFYPEGRKVRFEINTAVAGRLGLRLSSQLLSLGRIIDTAPGAEGS